MGFYGMVLIISVDFLEISVVDCKINARALSYGKGSNEMCHGVPMDSLDFSKFEAYFKTFLAHFNQDEVSCTLVGFDGVGGYKDKYEVKTIYNETEVEEKKSEGFEASLSGNNNDVLDEKDGFIDLIYKKDEGNEVVARFSKEDNSIVENKKDENKVIADNVDNYSNQNKVVVDNYNDNNVEEKKVSMEVKEEDGGHKVEESKENDISKYDEEKEIVNDREEDVKDITTVNKEDNKNDIILNYNLNGSGMDRPTYKQNEDSLAILNDGSLTIDILKDTDSKFCVVKKADFNNIPTQLYIPRAGYKIAKLMDGTDTIWQTDEGLFAYMVDVTLCKDDKPCLILIATKGEEYDDDCRYFEKRNSGWKEVSSVWYYLKLVDKVNFKMNNNVYDLDIRQKNHEAYTFLDCEMDFVHTNFYLNKTGYKVNNVLDGDQVLYTSDGLLESFLNVRVTLFEEKPILIRVEGVLAKLTRSLKYIMVDGSWDEIDDEYYNEVVKKIRNYNKLKMKSIPGVFKMDLNNVNLDHFEIIDKSKINESNSWVRYTTKKDIKLGSIMSDGQLIWNSEKDGDDANIVVVYLMDKPLMVQVVIKGDSNDNLYYDFLPGYWTKVDRKEYSIRLESIFSN